jgi:hypothetical protein
MTGSQLLNELRAELENNIDNLPTESAEYARRLHELEDRSLWSGRRRRVT